MITVTRYLSLAVEGEKKEKKTQINNMISDITFIQEYLKGNRDKEPVRSYCDMTRRQRKIWVFIYGRFQVK